MFEQELPERHSRWVPNRHAAKFWYNAPAIVKKVVSLSIPDCELQIHVVHYVTLCNYATHESKTLKDFLSVYRPDTPEAAGMEMLADLD
jgi:hypothetical protein